MTGEGVTCPNVDDEECGKIGYPLAMGGWEAISGTMTFCVPVRM